MFSSLPGQVLPGPDLAGPGDSPAGSTSPGSSAHRGMSQESLGTCIMLLCPIQGTCLQTGKAGVPLLAEARPESVNSNTIHTLNHSSASAGTQGSNLYLSHRIRGPEAPGAATQSWRRTGNICAPPLIGSAMPGYIPADPTPRTRSAYS